MTTRRLLTVATATAFGLGLTAASLFGPPSVATAGHHEGAEGHGHTHAKAAPLKSADISEDQARLIIDTASARAGAIDTKMNIAVVDAGGNLKAFMRMDGAWLGSGDIAIKKAKTARFFDMPTGNIGGLSQPGGPLYGIEHSNGGLITFPGGVPLHNEAGEIIGAVGISGSTVENDHDVAAAAAAAL